VPFGIAAGEGLPAVVHLGELPDHHRSGGLRRLVDGGAVGDDQVRRLRLAQPDLIRLHDRQSLGFRSRGPHRAQHDHPVAEAELGVSDGAIGVGVDCLLLEAEGTAQPLDGGGAVAVTQPGNDGDASVLSKRGHAGILPQRTLDRHAEFHAMRQ